MERWRKIFHDFYEVSSYGRVRRLALGGSNTFPGRFLNPSKNSRYPLVVLYGPGGVKKTVRVHILVARAFLGPCPLGKEVNHKDTDRWNCRLRNLEYATPKQNGRHALMHGKNPAAKISFSKAIEIRRVARKLGYRPGTHQRGFLPVLAKRFGLTKNNLYAITTRRTYR
jgi:HNH endonuclease/NUMOD4 motif-containing protein